MTITQFYPGGPGLPTTAPSNPNTITTAQYYENLVAIDPYQLNTIFDGLSAISVAGGQGALYGNLLLALQGLFRLKLTANLNVYVSTSGSDTANTGLSSSSPFATIQHAINFVQNTYDTNGYNVTISVGSGTFAGGTISGPFVGSGTVYIIGAGVSNTTINAVNSSCLVALNNAFVVVQAVTLTASGTGSIGVAPEGWCLYAQYQSYIQFQNVAFGTATQGHIWQNGVTASIGAAAGTSGNYSIIGNAPVHMQIYGQAQIECGVVELVGNFSFTQGFVKLLGPCSGLLVQTTFNLSYATFSGTSPYWQMQPGTQIYTGGAVANYLPGNVAGVQIGVGGMYN